MDVAFYAPLKPPDHPVPSGDRRVARLLMAALERSGYRPVLASRFRSYDGQGDAGRQRHLQALGSRIAAQIVADWKQPGAKPPDAWFTYHLYYKAPDWIGPAVSRELGIPYFVAEASYAPKRAGGPWNAGHEATARALRQAARVFCLNPNDVPCIAPVVAEPDRIVMLPPFLETAPYRQAADRRRESRGVIAGRHGLDPDAPWLLAVAMMRSGDKLQSYEALARSLLQLPSQPWQLLVVGDGPARPAVERAFAAFDPGRIRFTGLIDAAALPAIYAVADVFVWPAVNEAYGMALLEAQASGLPVLSARTGGVPGVVADGETGILVRPGDDRAFSEALARLIGDPALRDRFRAAALDVTATRHDIGTAAEILGRGMAGPP